MSARRPGQVPRPTEAHCYVEAAFTPMPGGHSMTNPDQSSQRRTRRELFLTGGVVASAAAMTGVLGSPQPAYAEDLPLVDSVNGQTGEVKLTAVDVGAQAKATADAAGIVADPESFPGIDPTGATDSTKGLQDALLATPNGGQLQIPGGTYRIDGNLSIPSGRSLKIVGYGATLVHSGNVPLLTASGEYGAPVAVGNLRVEDVTFGSGASAPVSRFSTTNNPGWRAGDVLKIVSDDAIPESRAGSGGNQSRLGEFAVVHAVDGKTTTLAAPLREPYSTNVRLVTVSEQTVTLEGMTFDTTDAGVSNSLGVTIHLMRLREPIIRNVRIRRASSIALQLSSCFGYSVTNCLVDGVTENLPNGQLGYGVLDNGSAFGRINGGLFRRVRHAYTDDSPRIAANSAAGGYGRTYGTQVVGAVATMTFNNAWDTHHSSESVQFISCAAVGGIPQGDQGFAAFGLRGKNHRVVGCLSIDMESGVTVFSEGASGLSYGHTVSDLLVRRATSAAILVNLNGDQHPDARQRSGQMSVRAADVIAEDCRRLLYSVNGTVRLTNAEFIPPVGKSKIEYNGITNRNSFIDARNILLDYTRNTAGVPQPFLAVSTDNSWTPGRQETVLDGVRVRSTASVRSRVSRPFIGGSHMINARGVEFNETFTVLPGDRHDSSLIEWRCNSDPGQPSQDLNSAYFYLGNAELIQDPMTRVRQSPNPSVIVKVNPTSQNYTATKFVNGYIRGQIVTFYIQDLVSGSWTISRDATPGVLLYGTNSRTLRKNDQLQVVWDGASWREIA